MVRDQMLIEVFGEDSLQAFALQRQVLERKEAALGELHDLRREASRAFNVDLKWPDYTVAAATGVLLGAANALFKMPPANQRKLFGREWVEHKHKMRSGAAVDYKVPTPESHKGSVHDLHRQIGPGHDLFRFKEAIELMAGQRKDFPLWGRTIVEHMEAPLHGGRVTDFRGFKIPGDPVKEFWHHMLIDFFTKRSLPIPGSTWLADHSQPMARAMLKMYDEGLNLKNALGNFFGFALVELIIHGYTFLFRAAPRVGFSTSPLHIERLPTLIETYRAMTRENEFHVMMMVAHGASFMVDSLITVGTKSYGGLFQLNYLSLLAFSRHLIQYLLQSRARYQQLLAEARAAGDRVRELDTLWGENFRSRIAVHFSNPDFVSIFDPEEWYRQDERLVRARNSIKVNLALEAELIKQLEA